VVQIAAVTHEPSAFRYLKNPSEAVMLAALQGGDISIINDIQNPSDKVLEVIINLLNNASDNDLIELLNNQPRYVRYIDNLSVEVKDRIFIAAPHEVLHLLKSPPSEALLYVIESQSRMRVGNILAVLIKILNVIPSEQIQLAVVKKNGQAIKYVENPSEVVQLAAVYQDPQAILSIKNPTENVIKLYEG